MKQIKGEIQRDRDRDIDNYLGHHKKEILYKEHLAGKMNDLILHKL